MKSLIAVIGCIIVSALAGCAAPAQRKAETESDYAVARAKLQTSLSSQRPTTNKTVVKRVVAANALPPEFDETVTLSRGDIASAEDLTRRLFRIVGAPIRVTREVEDYLVDRTKRSRDGRPAIVNPSAGSVAFATDENSLYNMSFTGSKRGLIDAVAARIGCYWKWENGTVTLFMTDTKTFFVVALPGSTTATETAKGSESGGARAELEITSQQSVWDELGKTVKSMLTSFGRVVTSPTNGSIVVTDTPDSLERVTKFISEQNRFLSRQVFMEVQVFNLTLNDDSSMGVDLNLAFNHLNKYGIQLVSGGGGAGSNAGSLALSVLDGATGDAGKFKGSSVILNALQAQGNVSNHRTVNVVSLNNHAAPLRIGRTTSYLATSTIATAANVGSTSSLQPGSVAEGYSINLTPTILEDGAVVLQLNLNISQLRQFRTVVSGNARIELPETDEQSTIQRAILRGGETLMLAGFEQDTKSYASNLGIMGIGQKGGSARTLLVILVTPTISAPR